MFTTMSSSVAPSAIAWRASATFAAVRGGAVRKPDDGAHRDARALESRDGVRDVGGAYADAEDTPQGGDLELGVDVCACEIGLEDRVIKGGGQRGLGDVEGHAFQRTRRCWPTPRNGRYNETITVGSTVGSRANDDAPLSKDRRCPKPSPTDELALAAPAR